MEGGALNPDMLCRDSEEPACRVGMLPDDSTGQGPDTLATKLSRRAPRERSEQRGCKEGMAHFLPSGYKFYGALRVSRYKFYRSRETVTVQNFSGGHWRSVAVKAISEPEICHGAGFKLRADARIRVQEPLLSCLGCRSKSKKCDKQLTHIVRVRCSIILSH
jgi:hypothetical protein